MIRSEASARPTRTDEPRGRADSYRPPSHRFWITESVLAAVYVALAVGLAVLSSEPPYATPLWTMIVLGAGGVAVLAVRHRHPRIAFAAAMALAVLSFAGGSAAESVLAVGATYIAGVRRTGMRVWGLFAVALLSGAMGALALISRGTIGPPILGLAPPTLARTTLLDWTNWFVIIAGALLIAALLGMNVGHRRRHINELVLRTEQLARERERDMELATARERERIAREMHDVIAHSLSVMIAVSDGAHAAADERPDEAKKAIGSVAGIGRRTLGEVRRLLSGVRGETGSAAQIAPQPDASGLPALAAEFTTAGLPVRLELSGSPSDDPVLGLTVYRIVQESLTNALRHARNAGMATVVVTWGAADVTIGVRNLGPLVPTAAHAGRGILGMRERAALYDGTIEVGPHVDGGWLVTAQLRYGASRL